MFQQIPAQPQQSQQQFQQQAAVYPPQMGSVQIVVPSKGLHIADVEFDVPAQVEAEVGGWNFHCVRRSRNTGADTTGRSRGQAGTGSARGRSQQRLSS